MSSYFHEVLHVPTLRDRRMQHVEQLSCQHVPLQMTSDGRASLRDICLPFSIRAIVVQAEDLRVMNIKVFMGWNLYHVRFFCLFGWRAGWDGFAAYLCWECDRVLICFVLYNMFHFPPGGLSSPLWMFVVRVVP